MNNSDRRLPTEGTDALLRAVFANCYRCSFQPVRTDSGNHAVDSEDFADIAGWVSDHIEVQGYVGEAQHHDPHYPYVALYATTRLLDILDGMFQRVPLNDPTFSSPKPMWFAENLIGFGVGNGDRINNFIFQYKLNLFNDVVNEHPH